MVLNFFNKFHCNSQNVMPSNASHSGMHPHMVGKISRFETGLPGSKFHSLTSLPRAITLTVPPQVPCLGNKNPDSNIAYITGLLSWGFNRSTHPKGLAQSFTHNKDPINVNDVNII